MLVGAAVLEARKLFCWLLLFFNTDTQSTEVFTFNRH